MATKDYLHSELLSDKRNDRVFQKTYATIDKFAKQMTKMEKAAFDIKDESSISRLEEVNSILFSDEIIELVNFTIHNFNKRKKH
jgi:hypothetical protein